MASDSTTIGRRGLLAAAAGGGAALLAACGDDERSSDGDASVPRPLNDAEIVGLLLRVERAEAAAFESALRGDLLSGRARGLAARFERHEQRHVARLQGLQQALGADRSTNRPAVRLTRGSALATLADVQALSSGAYLGLLSRARDPRVQRALVSIHAIEAQHAAALRRVAGRPYTPEGAFARPVGVPDIRRRLAEWGA